METETLSVEAVDAVVNSVVDKVVERVVEIVTKVVSVAEEEVSMVLVLIVAVTLVLGSAVADGTV